MARRSRQRAAYRATIPNAARPVWDILTTLVSRPRHGQVQPLLTSTPGGGDGYWSVLFTSDETNIDYYEGGSSSSSAKSAAQSTTQAASTQTTATSASAASAASDKATVITSIAPGKTVIITQTPAAAAATTSAGAAEKSQKGGSTNTAGVAAGVVVAVVVIAALAGAAFFFWRRRQRQQADSGHQQLSDYSNSNSSRPMTFRPAPGPDARIDPDAMAQRRMSDGSIADNEDYSRRILKVRCANADSTRLQN